MSREEAFFNSVYDEQSRLSYAGPCPEKRVESLREETKSWLAASGLSKMSSALVLEVGCGLAYLKDIHPGWHGVDVSASAVRRVKERYGDGVRIYQADAAKLPFPSEHFDGIYSWAVFEHVQNPSACFQEVDRVCRKGGCVLIAPAWNCRSWTVKKLPQSPYGSLGFADRLRKLTIPLREHLFFRALRCFPGRVYDEVRLLLNKPLELRFKPLSPQWDLILSYGHVSDDDAVADIDPHSAVCFFKSRGYDVISHPAFFSRVLARHEPVVAVKR